MKKSIDFLITQRCNYRCRYCSQSKGFAQNLKDADKDTIESFLSFLDKIPNDFEITITGGEPLLAKEFFPLIKKLKEKNFNFSVVTNFSFPIEEYKKLKDISGENLKELFVSLHLSQVKDKNEFLLKAKEFNNCKGQTYFTVGSVLSNENCEELKAAAEFFKENGIKFELQHMRIKNSFVKYDENAQNFIEKFPVTKIKEMSETYGKMCAAGKDFMFVYENGDAYRCYSSRFNRVHFLGNIKDKNFKMYDKILPCLNKKCTCPKPIINGLIDYNKSSIVNALFLSFYNLMFLPYYAVKNFEIVKAKIKQGFKI